MTTAERASVRERATGGIGHGEDGPIPDVRLRRLSALSALLAALLGVVVLMGWALDLDALKGLSGQTTVKPNTAVGFIAIALYALGGRARGGSRVAGRAAAVLVAALALGTLSQDLLGWNLGIDQALVAESQPAAATPDPGRMAPNRDRRQGDPRRLSA